MEVECSPKCRQLHREEVIYQKKRELINKRTGKLYLEIFTLSAVRNKND